MTKAQKQLDPQEFQAIFSEFFGPAPSADALATRTAPLAPLRLTGQRTLGAATRTICYVGAVLCAILLFPLTSGELGDALMLSVGLAITIAIVRAYGKPWTIDVGLDGVLLGPGYAQRVIAWRELRKFELLAAPPTFGFAFDSIRFAWGDAGFATLPGYSLTAEEGVQLRAAIEARWQRAQSYVEPDALRSIHRASRPVAAWIDALRSSEAAPFRSSAVSLSTLVDAIESGALSGLAMVECAVAIAVLGGAKEREALHNLAARVVGRDSAAAIAAAANGAFDHRSIDLATR
jgi:hypothetical protein